ncbi:hypothetical protein DFP73DRAFT_537007 [Morchella snyderi]|nr:hypothetical protein DFP73DRAFT_537007 [Morchella snyderi]
MSSELERTRRSIKSIAKNSQRTVGAHETQEPMGQSNPSPPTVFADQSPKVLDDITRSSLSTNLSSGSGNDQTLETKGNESPSSGQGACLGTDALGRSIDDGGTGASKSSCFSARPELPGAAVGAFRPDRLRRVATGHTQESIWAQLASDERVKVDSRAISDDEPKYGLFGTFKNSLPDRLGCLTKPEIHSKDDMEAGNATRNACGDQLDTISFKTPITKPMYTQSFGFSFSPKFEERPIPGVVSQVPSPFENIEKQGRFSLLKSPRPIEGSKHHSRGCTMGLVQNFGPFPAAMKTSKETGDQPPILATPPVASYLSEGCGSTEFKHGENMESVFTESEIYVADSGGSKDCSGKEFVIGFKSKLISFPGREGF